MKTEADLEKYLKKECAIAGFTAYKFSSPANRGVPDQIIVAPAGTVYFVELKHPITKPKPGALQQIHIDHLTNLDCFITVINSVEGVDALIEEIKDVVSWHRDVRMRK